jgi:hypothetical protein
MTLAYSGLGQKADRRWRLVWLPKLRAVPALVVDPTFIVPLLLPAVQPKVAAQLLSHARESTTARRKRLRLDAEVQQRERPIAPRAVWSAQPSRRMMSSRTLLQTEAPAMTTLESGSTMRLVVHL